MQRFKQLKGFRINLRCHLTVPSWKADPKSIRFFAGTIQRCVRSVSSATPLPQSLPVCNMQVEMRLLPQGHSFKLPGLSSVLRLQGQGAGSTWPRGPRAVFSQYWLTLATSDLCTNLTPGIREEGHRSSKGLVSKVCLRVGDGSRRVGGKRVNLSAAF